MSGSQSRLPVGLHYFATDQSLPVADFARAAAERGFDAVLLPEHTHMPVAAENSYPGGARGRARDFAQAGAGTCGEAGGLTGASFLESSKPTSLARLPPRILARSASGTPANCSAMTAWLPRKVPSACG